MSLASILFDDRDHCTIFQSKCNISEIVDKRIKKVEILYERNHFTFVMYLDATGLAKQVLKCITSGAEEYCEDEIAIGFNGKCPSQIVNKCISDIY